MKVCIIGNPNCGKSTIFNILANKSVPVGNWSGVTVSKNSAKLFDNPEVEIIDLPGIYTLEGASESKDEQITLKFLETEKYDLIINVIDSSNLQKSLFLTSQLLQKKKPLISVLNMTDNATRKGKEIDVLKLSNSLGVSVFQAIAKKGYGIDTLKNFISSFKKEDAQKYISEQNIYPSYSNIKKIRKKCESISNIKKREFTDKLDDIILNRYVGLPLFLFVMFAIFSSSIFIGTLLQGYIADIGQFFLIDQLKAFIEYLKLPDWFNVIVSDGFAGAIIMILQFVPLIAILYLLLAVLEESGYMTRAAFILDKFMSYFGMSGKAFLPLVTGYGCNVPSIIATRIIENPKERIATAMMIPFMSCGARLPVYALFCAAFFPNASGFIIFSLYMFGIFVAFLTSILLKVILNNNIKTHLIMEMPCYSFPGMKSIVYKLKSRVKDFVFNAGKVILIAFIALKVATQIDVNLNIVSESSDESIVSVAAKKMTPLFYPMGITDENWPAVVGIVTGAIAKEAVIGSLGALYLNVDYHVDQEIDPKDIEESQKTRIINSMQSKFDGKIGVYAYLLFILLYFPCVSTFAVLMREFNCKWAILSMTWSTGIAYVVAVSFFNIGKLIIS